MPAAASAAAGRLRAAAVAAARLRPARPALLLLAVILLLALVLRLKGVTWGLPYNFVNPDEGTIVPKAFRIATGELNPQFFFYPSFFFYLLAAVYWLASPIWWLLGHGVLISDASFVVDRGPYLLLARLVSVAFGTASVYLVFRLGRDAFGVTVGLLAALFLAVTPLHVQYSKIAVTDVTATAFGLAALVLLYGAATGRGRRWLVAGALVAGLATGTKYNLGALVLPATVAAVYACRDDVRAAGLARGATVLRWARLLAARVYAPMLLAFLVSSPYVVIDFPHFAGDFLRQSEIMRLGWLGFEHVQNGHWYNLDVNLAAGVGLGLLLLGVTGVAWALWQRRPFDLMVAPYVLVYFLYIGTWNELADRYLLPLIPLLLLLAARVGVAALRLRPARRILAPALAALVAAAFLVPLTDSIAYNRELSGPDVRVRAKTWVEAHIKPGSRIAADTYSPPLVRRRDMDFYRSAGVEAVPYRLTKLKLPVPGGPADRHDLRWLRARRVRYVIVTSAVYDRILAAAAQYPRVARFYERLERQGKLLKVFEPRPGERGPVIKVYRLLAQARPGQTAARD
jgi:4-amino-4-deoxy-L-arabinose transferase-like glycosyltransferase